ncbi:aldehyde dehydrogenase family protein [Burkholderia cepacia]|uniref:aldehyde dehydrogenase family protein n=1 Tax=Burkholderia cepacia TaxID=292 RepID=UPI0018C79121|nr:aldehyde dehydrogenase family protein [Burkholderia cepacia]MCA8031003.1 aldehyde dehydrogenase family protein [Burkholderia cepacia]
MYNQIYVDGRFQPSSGTTSVPVVSPSTKEVVGNVTICTIEEAESAVRNAHRALSTWAGSTHETRKSMLVALRRELEARTDAIAHALAVEMGCPVWLGRLMQVPMALRGVELAIAGIDEIVWSERIGNGLVNRVPVGVIAAITPWNFPLHQIVAKVAASIAAGCTLVIKPSEVAPGAAQLFMEALNACGLPPGVVNLVWGDAEVGRSLVRNPLVSKVSFTGSTAVGRQIMIDAAQNLTPVTLELGGKSAAVLLEDADLDAAIPGIMRLALANSGQACVSQSRLIAPKRLVSEIESRFHDQLKGWPVGDPLEDSTRLGPVATETQYRHIHSLLESATSEGAKVPVGITPHVSSEGYYVAPTLITGVSPEMKIAQQEVFGPVLSVIAYDSEAQALEFANATRYGLSGAVWSRDNDRAAAFASRMRTGQVILNGAPQNLATPFGGFGDSGFGRENGRFGIEELLTYQSLHGTN